MYIMCRSACVYRYPCSCVSIHIRILRICMYTGLHYSVINIIIMQILHINAISAIHKQKLCNTSLTLLPLKLADIRYAILPR